MSTATASATTVTDRDDTTARRARARRMALLLAVVAVVFYGTFLWFQLTQSRTVPPSREWVPAPAATPDPSAARAAPPPPAEPAIRAAPLAEGPR